MVERVEKPWGWYEVLDEGEGYKVKKLFIKWNEETSLQLHRKRSELVRVISGWLGVKSDLDHPPLSYGPGDFVEIEKCEVHKFVTCEGDVTLIEIQTGECDEDDIIRIEDKYGRGTD